MEEKKYSMGATTIRLTEEMTGEIRHLAERTHASQADVIRQLLSMALGEKSRFVIKQSTDIPDEVKRGLFDVAEGLADIRTQLSRIGSNINIRRRKYNGDRKVITDRISALHTMMIHDDNMYAKSQHQIEMQRLQQRLDEFDSLDTSMVSNDEWTRFQELLQEFNSISLQIGEKIQW